MTGLLLVGGGGLGLRYAEDRANEIGSDGSPVVRILWPEAVSEGRPAAWPPAQVQRDLLERAYAIVEKDPGPFSAATLESLGSWFGSAGWAADVRRVERVEDGVIEVEASWRAPAAVVRDGAQDFLIAVDGCRLPISWRADAAPFPVIVGAPKARALSVVPGTVWPDEAVQAGLELLLLLQEHIPGSLGADQIMGVSVARYTSERRLELLTDRGHRIVWGRRPSDPVPDAVTTEAKLQQLAHLRRSADFGHRIDAGQTLIDISAGPVLVESAAAAAQDHPR